MNPEEEKDTIENLLDSLIEDENEKKKVSQKTKQKEKKISQETGKKVSTKWIGGVSSQGLGGVFPFLGKVISPDGNYVIFEHSKIRYSRAGVIGQAVQEKDAIKVMLELTNKEIILKPKDKKLSLIKIPIDEIKSYEILKIYVKPTKFKVNQVEIITNNEEKHYLRFGNVSYNIGEECLLILIGQRIFMES